MDSEAGFIFNSQFRIVVSEKRHFTEEGFHVAPNPTAFSVSKDLAQCCQVHLGRRLHTHMHK